MTLFDFQTIKKQWYRRKDFQIVIGLLLLTLLFRVLTQMMIHTGADERDYWYAAKALTQGFEYPAFSHRTVRWSIILPTAFFQLLFGVHPNVYYIGPLLNALLQIVLLYKLGKMVKGRVTGVLASLMLIFFPYQIRAASQVRPEIYSITYILLCAYLFFVYLKTIEEKKRIVFLVLSSLTMFAAYLTKITNLFFLPGFFIAILLFHRSKRIRDCFIFGGILLGLFLIETGLYAMLTDYKFGRLQIIMANHLSSNYMDAISGFWDLFRRYSNERLDFYWQAPFALFGLLSAYYLIKSQNRDLKTIILLSFGFFFFITFTVSSLDPLKPAEDFINRYFCGVLPFVFLVIAWFLDDTIFQRGITKARNSGFTTDNVFIFGMLGIALAVCIVFALPLPQSVRQYAYSPIRPREHTFYRTADYYTTINNAWQAGVPFVSTTNNGGTNAVLTVSRFFLASDTYTENRPPELVVIEKESLAFNVLAKSANLENEKMIQVIRNPFRFRTISKESLPKVNSEEFVD